MSEHQWIWDCDRVIPSETLVGREVVDELLHQLEAEGWDPHDVFSVHVALEEALVNAIRHGNRFSKKKHVRIACRISPTLVRIEITDEGDGFDPTVLPDPTGPDRLDAPFGRGVLLMKSFMSRVQFNAVGNYVVLEKDRAAAR